ncbi:MAG: hypothetical protein MET45_28110 [Nostoc sp. LLA-1]|nr:hypothetical protein [Cyanocohniella sp. LLY]
MQEIKDILVNQDIDFSEDEILEAAQALGMNVNDLNDAEVQAIAQKVAQSKQPGKLAKNSNKPKNSNGKLTKNSSRRKSVPNLEGAISKASQVSNEEIQSLEDVLNAGIDAYTTDKADQLLSSIRNAPKEVVRKFTQAAMEEEADVESFRNIGEQLVTGIFGISATNAAE